MDTYNYLVKLLKKNQSSLSYQKQIWFDLIEAKYYFKYF